MPMRHTRAAKIKLWASRTNGLKDSTNLPPPCRFRPYSEAGAQRTGWGPGAGIGRLRQPGGLARMAGHPRHLRLSAARKRRNKRNSILAVAVSAIAMAAAAVATSQSASASPLLTIWPASAAPPHSAVSDTMSTELGVVFRSSAPGRITGVRFYKSAQNTGQHVGSLWDVSGARLASVTFTRETASGWQRAIFAKPVSIRAFTTYTASYTAPRGRYADDPDYFAGGPYVGGHYLNGLLRQTNGGISCTATGVSL